jgi:hypothetical protein
LARIRPAIHANSLSCKRARELPMLFSVRSKSKIADKSP